MNSAGDGVVNQERGSGFFRIKERFYEIAGQVYAARVEKLGLRVGMLEQYPPIRQERLKRKTEKQLALFEKKAAGILSRLEDAVLEPRELFSKQFAPTEAKLNNAYRLRFREYRQILRREEGIVDGNNNLSGELSAGGIQRLREYEERLEAEKREIIKQKADLFIQKESAKQKDRTKAAAALADRSREFAGERERLERAAGEKADQAYARFTAANERRIAAIRQKLAEAKQKAQAAGSRTHTPQLPPDVALRLDGLCMYFGGLKAVDNLSFDVKKGEIFGLIGPNGAGKTTVFNCITQFYKPSSGEIWFNDRYGETLRLNKYAVHNIIKTGIVRTFQNIELVAELTVLENLLIAAHTQYHSGFFSHMFYTSALKRETEVLKAKALGILEEMDLLRLKDAYPVGMPYGILKRIELARTLMAKASLIILDEPAAGLNEKETEELMVLIKRISKEYEAAIFLVEHDMGLVMDICDHICAISFGKKLAYGTPREIQDSRDVQEAYLGVE
jgi:branched-chain amino acid transport system ATP-binding protein